MKLHSSTHKKSTGFTLIEMIGVLAVIAILAAVLVPKVFTAISNARINNTAMSVQTVKTALADHYAKYGSIPLDGTTSTTLTLPAEQFDQVLLKEQFLDKPFVVKIGDGTNSASNTRIEIVNISSLTVGGTVAAAAGGGDATGFALAGGTTNNITGAALVQAVITGVNESDAQDLSDRLDGTTMTSPAIGTDDLSGRVKYVHGTPTTVYVYITHR